MESISQSAQGIALIIIALAGVAGAIYMLINHNSKFRAWLDKRRERQSKLDHLIANADKIQCSKELTEQIQILANSVEELTRSVERTKEHNLRQDREIARSLKQREVHDIALFALVEVAKKEGNNGAVANAYQAMLAYMRDQANTPYAEILIKGEGEQT